MMKKYVPLVLQANRVRRGDYATDDTFGMAGMFRILMPSGSLLLAMSSGIDKERGWEHVVVSGENHCPTWAEMVFVKDLFWDEEECVVQYHPPKSQVVPSSPNSLHLWRPLNLNIPMPPRR